MATKNKPSDRKVNALIALANRGEPSEKKNAKQKLEEMLENGTLEYNKEKINNIDTRGIPKTAFHIFIIFFKLPFLIFVQFKDTPFKDWFYSKTMFKEFIKEIIRSVKHFLIFLIPSIIGVIFMVFALIIVGIIFAFFEIAKKIGNYILISPKYDKK
jgi:hypothetical protein